MCKFKTNCRIPLYIVKQCYIYEYRGNKLKKSKIFSSHVLNTVTAPIHSNSLHICLYARFAYKIPILIVTLFLPFF